MSSASPFGVRLTACLRLPGPMGIRRWQRATTGRCGPQFRHSDQSSPLQCDTGVRGRLSSGNVAEKQVFGVKSFYRYNANICIAHTPSVSPSLQSLVAPHQLHELLRTARRARRMTQKALAARLGLSQSRLSYLESHPGEISVEQLVAWTAAVGLSLAVGVRRSPSPVEHTSGW